MAVIIGKADANGNRIYPEWLIALTPGAAEAKALWESEKAKRLPELTAAQRTAIRAAGELGYWQRTGSGDAFYGKHPEVSTPDFEAAQSAKREAEKAVNAEARRIDALRKHYLDLMQGEIADPEERKRLIAKFALRKNSEIASLWDQLNAAMDAREEAYDAAGAPGRSWEYDGNITDPSNALAQMKRTMTSFIEGFDTFSISRMLDGEDVPHEFTPKGDEIYTATKR
ncbi:hypothetical protein M1D88_12585 [Arthrobacter sp. R1-13]